MMTTLFYDGSFEGLLSAVFEIYQRKLDHVKISRGDWYSTALFEDKLIVVTNEQNAARVLKGLKQKISPDGLQRLYVAHLSGLEAEDYNLLCFIRYVFDSPVNIEEDFGNRYVLRVSELVRMMRREKHRMEAFIRFQKLNDGLFYAAIDPDFNVLPMLIRHFKSRYADQKWMIYDLRRKYGLYYDLNEVQFIEMDFTTTAKSDQVIAAYNEDESIYQSLWKNYFNSVNIKERKNTKLHLRHIPKRYWKHLTEKI
jgi:probable DNA metabolism protein